MKIDTYSYSNFQSATIEKTTPVVSILLTADCVLDTNIHQVAVSLIYGDLLLAGAGRYDRDSFLYAINELGASISVTENDGQITITVKTLDKNLAKTLKLLELMITSPIFAESELKRGIETAENALILHKDDSKALAHSFLRRALYAKTDRHFIFTPDELLPEVKTVSVEDLKNLHAKFRQAYWTVSIGGDRKSIKQSLVLVEKMKKNEPEKRFATIETKKQLLKGNKLFLQAVKSKQNIDLSIGGLLPLTLEDKELAPFTFGLAVLGKWGGFAGRLMSTVREKEGLTYGIYAKTEGLSKTETGYWRIMTFFAPKDTLKGITSTLREVKKIQEHGITQSEWERFRNILKTGEVLVYDSLTSTVGFVHGALLSGLTFDEYRLYRERLYNCTRSEVNQALKKHLDTKNLIFSAAGPVDKVSKELKVLVKNNS